MPTMIFHAAYPLNPNATSASGIRPVKMRQAFIDAGYEVIDITGHGHERRLRWERCQRAIERGELNIDFLYSENATIPLSFTEPRHFPIRLGLDREIFRFCHNNGIPTSVFYRDVFWRFPEYDERIKPPVSTVMKWLYRHEIATYERYADVVFVPTVEMARLIPNLTTPRIAPLPPGGASGGVDEHRENSQRNAEDRGAGDALSIFYVGGIGGHYQLHELAHAVAGADRIALTICTSPSGWQSQRVHYPEITETGTIHVVHESGEGLEPLYRDADVCSIVVDPDDYWDFAAPVKLYEYIAQGKPIIASSGTHVARVVADLGIGWVVEANRDSVRSVLEFLRDHPEEVASKRQRCESIRGEHTWLARARHVAEIMRG